MSLRPLLCCCVRNEGQAQEAHSQAAKAGRPDTEGTRHALAEARLTTVGRYGRAIPQLVYVLRNPHGQ